MDRLDEHDKAIKANTDRIEINEINARSMNMRVYGFNYKLCKKTTVGHNNETITEIIQPMQLIHTMMLVGFGTQQDDVNKMKFAALHWVTKSKTPFIMIKFLTMDDKKCFERKRRFLNNSYTPHGSRLTIRNDWTKLQG